MEIKPQELRIGNLLDRNGIMEVLGIGANNKLIIYDHYNKERLPYGLDVDSFNPIELTPEWLTRLGFKMFNESNQHYVINDPNGFKDLYKIHIFPTINDQWHIAFSDVITGKEVTYIPTTKISYVHQLQNLYFSLTGEELAIDKQISNGN